MSVLDRDQLLAQAVLGYLSLLAQEQPPSIAEFAATVDPELREELAQHLELVLALGAPEEPDDLSREDKAMVERAAGRVLRHYGLQRRPA